MHKKLHFWLYSAAFAWWAVEFFTPSAAADNSFIPLYQSLTAIDIKLPGDSFLPPQIPAGAVYLLIAGFIAHKKGH